MKILNNLKRPNHYLSLSFFFIFLGCATTTTNQQHRFKNDQQYSIQDQIDYFYTEQINTQPAFYEYLSKHPKGKFVNNVRTWINESEDCRKFSSQTE